MDINSVGLSPDLAKTFLAIIGLATLATFTMTAKSFLDAFIKWRFNRREDEAGAEYRRKSDEDISNIYKILRDHTGILSRLETVSATQTKIMEKQVDFNQEHMRLTARDSLLISQIHEQVAGPGHGQAMGRRRDDVL